MAEIALDKRAEKQRSIATPEDVEWLEAMLDDDTPIALYRQGLSPALLEATGGQGTGYLTTTHLPAIAEALAAHRVRSHYDGVNRTLYLVPNDVMFGRTKLPQQLTQAERTLAQNKATAEQYAKLAADGEATVTSLRERINNPTPGLDVNEVTRIVSEWPEVVDFRVGPCYDPMSRSLIPPGALVISFIPILFDGHDVPRAGAERYAISTIVRLQLNEDGQLKPMAGTIHPHMTEAKVCTGNLSRVLSVFLRENNVMGALDLLRQFRLGHWNGDWLDNQYAQRAWAWLESHVVNGVEPWMLGNWDGVTVQISNPETPIVRLDEFFGASVADIIHVGTGKLHHVGKEDVKAYLEAKETATEEIICSQCGGDILGCPCHGTSCTRSGLPSYACDAGPVDENWVCPPTDELRMPNGSMWRHFNRNDIRGNGGQEYTCRKEDKNYEMCGEVAPWYDTYGASRPYVACDKHVQAGVIKKWNERVKERSKRAGALGPEAMTKTIRHKHTHRHANFYRDHTHHHEHPLEAALAEEELTTHMNNHTAYRGATGETQIRHRQDMPA